MRASQMPHPAVIPHTDRDGEGKLVVQHYAVTYRHKTAYRDTFPVTHSGNGSAQGSPRRFRIKALAS